MNASVYDATHRPHIRNLVRDFQVTAKGYGMAQRFHRGGAAYALVTAKGEFLNSPVKLDLARFVAAVMVNRKGDKGQRRAMVRAVRELRAIA